VPKKVEQINNNNNCPTDHGERRSVINDYLLRNNNEYGI